MIPLWAKALAALAALAAVLAIGYGRGHANSDTKWQARWDARNALEAKALHDRDTAAVPKIIQEGTDYAKALATPVLDPPHVLVCPSAPGPARAVRAAASPGRAPDAAPVVRTEAPRDIGPAIVTVGADADAQVIALQAYVRDVCLK